MPRMANEEWCHSRLRGNDGVFFSRMCVKPAVASGCDVQMSGFTLQDAVS